MSNKPSNVSVIPFQFQSHQIRTVLQNNEPWFVVSDVCRILGHSNASMAVKILDEDERSKLSLGRQGLVWVVSESGLYALILKSDKSEAKPFRKWVTSEMLPAIRKTGSYSGKERFDFGLRRFLGSFNEKGQFSLKEIPQNSHIVSMQELPERIADPNNFIGDRETERELMMEIALAAIARGALGATTASRMISLGKRVSLGPAALKTTI